MYPYSINFSLSFRAFQRSIAGAATNISAMSKPSNSTSYKISRNKRDKKSRRRKAKIEDNDLEAANDFLLSGENGHDMDSYGVSTNHSPDENMRGRKRPKDSMSEQLV